MTKVNENISVTDVIQDIEDIIVKCLTGYNANLIKYDLANIVAEYKQISRNEVIDIIQEQIDVYKDDKFLNCR